MSELQQIIELAAKQNWPFGLVKPETGDDIGDLSPLCIVDEERYLARTLSGTGCDGVVELLNAVPFLLMETKRLRTEAETATEAAHNLADQLAEADEHVKELGQYIAELEGIAL